MKVAQRPGYIGTTPALAVVAYDLRIVREVLARDSQRPQELKHVKDSGVLGYEAESKGNPFPNISRPRRLYPQQTKCPRTMIICFGHFGP